MGAALHVHWTEYASLMLCVMQILRLVSTAFWNIWQIDSYNIVSCGGVAQLGGQVPGYP